MYARLCNKDGTQHSSDTTAALGTAAYHGRGQDAEVQARQQRMRTVVLVNLVSWATGAYVYEAANVGSACSGRAVYLVAYVPCRRHAWSAWMSKWSPRCRAAWDAPSTQVDHAP